MEPIESNICEMEMDTADSAREELPMRRIDREQIRRIGHETELLPMRHKNPDAPEVSMQRVAALAEQAAISIGILLVPSDFVDDAESLSADELRMISQQVSKLKKSV